MVDFVLMRNHHDPNQDDGSGHTEMDRFEIYISDRISNIGVPG